MGTVKGNKKSSKGKSNSEALREMREKQAEKSAKKQPTKAKPKKEKPAKVAKKKGSDKPAEKGDGWIEGGALTDLKAEANRLLPEIKQGFEQYGRAYEDAVELHKKVEDFQQRELWRYCDTPYKSWSACVKDMAAIAGKGSATLFAIIGLQKALPGTTAEQRAKIGPRKGAIAARASKVAKKKGEELPPEIVEKAQTQSESEFRETVRDAGLIEETLPPLEDSQEKMFDAPDPLMASTAQNTMPFNPRKGGSGVVEGDSADAQQFSGVVQEAIDAARVIYDGSFTDIEALEFVCKMYLLSPCEKERFEDTTNRAAADEIRKEAKSGKKAKTAHA